MGKINFSEIKGGEQWELFCRDFLQELGFIIDSPPNRGPDRGKDMVVREILKGELKNTEFKWLVSCKHTKRAVGKKEEADIADRIKKFSCDGFMGIYSFMPANTLVSYLEGLENRNEIKDFKILDGMCIEKKIMEKGMTLLLKRYFPDSYKKIKPTHELLDKIVPLKCDYCEEDFFLSEPYEGILVFVSKWNNDDTVYIDDIYLACKNKKCDRILLKNKEKQGYRYDKWQDISDLFIPNIFLYWIINILNNIQTCHYKYSNKAFDKIKDIIVSIAQKVFREMTEEESKRSQTLFRLKFY